MFTMKSEVVGRPHVVSDDLIQNVDQSIYKRWRFTISKLACYFPKIVCTVIYNIITG
jgi:hypothetical protein